MRALIAILAILALTDIASAYALQYNPYLLQSKDRHGKRLSDHVDQIYASKIIVEGTRCSYISTEENSYAEYEIDKCQIAYQPEKVSPEEKDNGVSAKGKVWLEGAAYRSRTANGEWSKWTEQKGSKVKTWGRMNGVAVRKQNGLFVFSPGPGFSTMLVTGNP